MARPTNREEFKDYILRRLGAPVLQINIDDEQLDDRIDDAIRKWQENHYDGTEQLYLPVRITDQDKARKYVQLDNSIIGVTRVFPVGDMYSGSTNNIFNVRYQFFLNDLYSIDSTFTSQYVIAMRHISMLQEVFNGQKPIRFNKHQNRVFVDMKWDELEVQYLVFECFKAIDPEDWPDAWGDDFLLKYATACVKEQWGDNLTKHVGIAMPGGVMFNGERILSDARADKEKIEADMISTYSPILNDLMG